MSKTDLETGVEEEWDQRGEWSQWRGQTGGWLMRSGSGRHLKKQKGPQAGDHILMTIRDTAGNTRQAMRTLPRATWTLKSERNGLPLGRAPKLVIQ